MKYDEWASKCRILKISRAGGVIPNPLSSSYDECYFYFVMRKNKPRKRDCHIVFSKDMKKNEFVKYMKREVERLARVYFDNYVEKV